MKRLISNKEFIGCAIGVIYRQAPQHKPRDIDKIVDYIIDYFYLHADPKMKTQDKSFSCLEVDEKDLDTFVRDILFGCQEFKNLNLSQYEVDNGIDVNDEKRDGFVIVDAYTKIKSYYDFIDLDACVRNIVNTFNGLFLLDDFFEEKIFLCKKNEDGELELIQ